MRVYVVASCLVLGFCFSATADTSAGEWWRNIGYGQKVAFIDGSAAGVDLAIANAVNVNRKLTMFYADRSQVLHEHNADIVYAMDKFYTDPANSLIPIGLSLNYCLHQVLNDISPKALNDLLYALRKNCRE